MLRSRIRTISRIRPILSRNRRGIAEPSLQGAGNRRSSCRQGTWGYRSGANVSPLTKHPSGYCSLQTRLSVTGASLSGSGAVQPQEVPSESIALPFMELRYQSRQSWPSVTGASNSGGVPTESITSTVHEASSSDNIHHWIAKGVLYGNHAIQSNSTC